jgi:hypothetical protein
MDIILRMKSLSRAQAERTTRGTVRRTVALCLFCALPLMTLLGLPCTATADLPFLWSTPDLIGHSGASNYGVSCTSTSLCVAVESLGDVLTSTNLTAEPPTWTVTHVDGANTINGVSCVSTSLCVAVDHAGNVLTSTDPTDEHPVWTVKNVDPAGSINGVSCVSTSLCVAVDHAGNVLTSTTPTEPSSIWTIANVDKNPHTQSGDNTIYSVSCPSVSLCVAVDSAGNVVSSTNPNAASPIWTVRSVEGNVIYGVSCASVSLCVAVDAGGNVVDSTDPNAESPTWNVTYHVDIHQLYGVSCVSSSTCIAVDSAGNIVSSTAATSGAPAWSIANVDGAEQLYGVSCASLSLCVAVDSAGNGLVGRPAPAHTLSVSLAGSGSGVVIGPEINCPHTCSSSYANGTSVSLTATPASGSVFAGWNGACSGVGVCNLILGSDETVSATFVAAPYIGRTSASTGATDVTVAGAIVSRHNGVGMPLRCWARSGNCVPAMLKLVVVERLRGHRVVAVGARNTSMTERRKVIVGKSSITISAGQTRTASVYLNPTGRKLLARYHTMTALLLITGQHGQALWKQTVRLFHQPARRRKPPHT